MDRVWKQQHERITSTYYDVIYKMALSKYYDNAIAEDCTHDVIMNVALECENWDTMDEVAKRAYLYRATTNTMINILNKMNREIPSGLADDVVFQGSAYNEKYEWLRGKYGFGEDIDEFLASLKECDRQMVIMRFAEDKTYKMIAEELGLSEDVVAKHIRRALTKIRGFFLDKEVRYDEKEGK